MWKKKSLGQHFLTSPYYLSMIADAAEITPGDVVLEVGPGEGFLTKVLLSRGARVVAVEKDHRLIPLLRERFAGQALTVVECDVLEFDPNDNELVASGYTLIGNIPYYITGALIRKFLSEDSQPRRMTLLVQKEVAERIARAKKESILSLSVKVFGEPHYVKTVPRGAFAPPPKIDSAILTIKNISHEHFTNRAHEEWFFALVRAGFAQKRKLLKRNLEPLLGENYSNILQNIGIPENARAEDVPLEKWLLLSQN